jgi:hypothetical protein
MEKVMEENDLCKQIIIFQFVLFKNVWRTIRQDLKNLKNIG